MNDEMICKQCNQKSMILMDNFCDKCWEVKKSVAEYLEYIATEKECSSCKMPFCPDARKQVHCQDCMEADSEWENPDTIEY